MREGLVDRLARILPGGKGVWVPMDHGISGYPEKGLERMDEVISSCISGGADAIVLQKGALSTLLRQQDGVISFVMYQFLP
jgi:DhnA family fructose-bisphosphate aldolase class Ia